MVIPPNQVSTYTTQYPPGSAGLPVDISILSVFPHMHLLGQKMKVFGIQPNLDTLKLIDIPHWDFHWQDFYFFKQIQKAPQGTTLKASATYDNTTGNIHNPNNPPITVYAGLNTADEMFLVYNHYMLYEAGDETYNLDSLMNASLASLMESSQEESLFSVYPNPFSNGINIYSPKLASGDILSISIYDIQGKLVRKLMQNEAIETNEMLITWDGQSDQGEEAGPGLYYMSINRNGELSNHRLMKQ